jgi:group I intron endonuclease
MEFNYQGNALKGGTYRIVNTATNQFYIGSCKRFKSRWGQHAKALETGKHSNRFLLNSFQKHGTSVFVFEVLEVVDGSREERLAKEQLLLDDLYDNQQMCYNLRKQAVSRQGFKAKDERSQQEKIAANPRIIASQFKSGKDHPYYGKPGSNAGRVFSKEARQHMSEAHVGKPGYWRGKPRSEETKNKIRNTLKNRKKDLTNEYQEEVQTFCWPMF